MNLMGLIFPALWEQSSESASSAFQMHLDLIAVESGRCSDDFLKA